MGNERLSIGGNGSQEERDNEQGILSTSLDSYGSISSSSLPPSTPTSGGPSNPSATQVMVTGQTPTVPSKGLISASPLMMRQQMMSQQQQRGQRSANEIHGGAMMAQSYRIMPIRPRHKRRIPGAKCCGGYSDCCGDSDDDDTSSDGGDEDNHDDEEDSLLSSKDRLLQQAKGFDLAYNPERGYRATELKFFSLSRPHMRAMHASWICFFSSYFVQFSMAPLLPQLQNTFHLSKRDIWLTNVWMMIGGVPTRFMLGPLCDSYGPRTVMTWILALCAIPCALSGLIVVNLYSLILVRFIIGAMDGFVPCQCWITSHFVREVGGTIMAIAGGLGASGSAVTQLVVGFLFTILANSLNGDKDLAWRLALLFPAAFALLVAYMSFRFSDDCPLGNFIDVKRAGLMMQRSAVDSFRSGVYNLNSWLLFLQYAGSSGVDITMCNGCALYYHYVFDRPIAVSGAIASLYGISAVYARAAGGYISDKFYDKFALRGRLCIHFACMLLQGGLNIWFARSTKLGESMVIMFVFSILIQVRIEICIFGYIWMHIKDEG